jgi:acetyl esterase
MKVNENKMILDPIVQTFVDALAKQGGTPIYKLSPADARKLLENAQSGDVKTLPADIQDLTIDTAHGDVNLHIYRPQGITHTLPIIIFIHGAGWVMGSQKTHDRLVREITNGAQAAVVFVQYTLAPEGQYPLLHEQGYAAAKWIHEHSTELNLDNSRMAIVGDSVGGCMATSIALMAQERGGPKFIFQALFYPVANARFDTASYEQFAQGPWLTKSAMQWFWDNYVPNQADRALPFASPLQASLEQLKGLPPTLLFTNENDVLRDEGEAYAHKLMQAGVSVVAMRLIGMIHDSMMLNAISQAPAVRTAIALANQMLRDVFAK